MLTRFGLYRAFTSVYGLIYLVIGLAIPLFFVFSLTRSMGDLTGSGAGSLIVVQVLPTLLPLFATVGGLGVVYLFSTDRSNGVYEYLVATRKIKVRDIFISYSMVEAVAVSIILGINIAIECALFYGNGTAFLTSFLKLVLIFSIPVAFFSSLISVMAMLTWSSLSKRYPGVNAPGGIGSVIGVIPPLVFLMLGLQSDLVLGNIYLLAGVFSIAMFVIFVVMLVVITRLMSNERMLG